MPSTWSFSTFVDWLQGNPPGSSSEGSDQAERRRQARPRPRSIPWRPVQGEDPGELFETGWPDEVFVVQAVLAGIRGHLPHSPGDQRYGFLLGRRLECPATGDPYLLIDEIWAAPDPLRERGGSEEFEGALEAARRSATEGQKDVLGWYHTHSPLMGLQLSEHDVRLHSRFFPERWHCALVEVAHGEEPVGGLFQRRQKHRYPGTKLISFLEVTEGNGGSQWGEMESQLDWTNYRTPRADVRRVAPPREPGPVIRARGKGSTSVSTDDEPVRRTPASGPSWKWLPLATPEKGESGSRPRSSGADRPASPRPRSEQPPGPGTEPPPGPRSEQPPGPGTEPPPRHRQAGSRRRAPTEPAESGDGRIRDREPEPARPAAEAQAPPRPERPTPVPEGVERPEAEPEGVEHPKAEPEGVERPKAEPAPEPRRARPERPTPSRPPPSRPPSSRPPRPYRSEDRTRTSLPFTLEPSEEVVPGGSLSRAVDGLRGVIAARSRQSARAPDSTPPAAASSPRAGLRPPRPGPRRPRPGPQPARPGPPTFDQDAVPIPDIPVVMPSGDADGSPRNPTARQSVGKAARLLLVVPLLGLAVFFVFRGEGGTEPIAPDGFHPAAGPAEPGATGVGGRAEFERLRTRLSESLAAYSDRRAEFDLGRVDCAALAAAHRTAQRDFIRLSNQVARRDGGLAASQREAWRGLVGETSAMDGHFQESGCDTATRTGGEG